MNSSLERIIPPEIRDDELYRLLENITSREPLFTVLEIGSSSGEGSTAALVEGLSQNPARPMLFCLEASKKRFTELATRYSEVPFVRCLNASSVTADRFPSENDIEEFWVKEKTNLNHYPLDTVISWLREDIRYLNLSGVLQGGIALIKESYSINLFDLVLIDGSEFTGEAELDEVIGARWIVLDDINAYKNYRSYHRLSADPEYVLVAENWGLRNGYAVFRHRKAHLPVHFFTIVLNGMPFIYHHIDAFRHLPFRWHWHIVEGVADLIHDTAWSRPNGGHIPGSYHKDGLSIDGTSRYIDQLHQLFPENITVYRKPPGHMWQGKLEMINAPLDSIQEDCLLWEIDADECWTHAQLCAGWRMFHVEPQRNAAFYWCHFFVGPGLVVNSRNCYSQMAGLEWLRTWRYQPGCRWVAHEPPRLVYKESGTDIDTARPSAFTNEETEAKGLVFQHFAYVTLDQVRFKEKYYGYAHATYHWLRLQKERNFPAKLGDYLQWVKDGTTFDTADSQKIIPLPVKSVSPGAEKPSGSLVVIDGVFFQYHSTGIARVWQALLEELSGSSFAGRVVILDRGTTVPRIQGYRYIDIPLHDESSIHSEREKMQAICDSLEAELFISTWHTTPIQTKSLLMVHDMLPELLLGEQRLDIGRWQEKNLAINHAAAFVAVSENTAHDLIQWYPEKARLPIHIMHNGVSKQFSPAPPEQIERFRASYGISSPYFLFVGPREWYKNFRLLLDAFVLLPEANGYCIVSPHGENLEKEFGRHPAASFVKLTGRLSEEDLVAAYSGAMALIYPSYYEGFGLPPLEAMACGCPVITSNAPAMVEVCGDAALKVAPDDHISLAKAMENLNSHDTRIRQIKLGYERAGCFKWSHSASRLLLAICGVTGGQQGVDNIVMERPTTGEENG